MQIDFEGLISIFGGVVCLLMVFGIFPRSPVNPEEMAHLRRRFGSIMTVGGPIMVLYGIAQLFGYVSK
jgi:hypothetical protein